MSDAARRGLLLLGVVVVVTGLAVADAGHGGAARAPAPSPGAGEGSVSGLDVAPPGAESSAWFCVGGTARGGTAASTLVLTNPTPTTATAAVRSAAVGYRPAPATVSVSAGSQAGVLQDPETNGVASASTVLLRGGGVGVSQMVSGPLGPSPAPCASTTSGRWYFADGSTTAGSSLSLSLYNPTATVAVVDVSCVDRAGTVAPAPYQGIEVPGGALVVENRADHLIDTPDIATVVTTLSGQVVAAELQSAGTRGDGGPSVVLGATAAAPVWSFPANRDVPGGSTVFHVFNPSARPVEVTVTFGLAQGTAEPLVVRVPPATSVSLDTDKVTRLPSDVVFSATFRATGAGVVVARRVSAAPRTPSAATASAPQVGETLGVPAGASRWLLPAVSAPATGISTLAVSDLSTSAVTLHLLAVEAGGRLVAVGVNAAGGLDPVPGSSMRLRPGAPLVITPATGATGTSAAIGSTPLVLRADGPVAVELDTSPVGAPGAAVVPALALR